MENSTSETSSANGDSGLGSATPVIPGIKTKRKKFSFGAGKKENVYGVEKSRAADGAADFNDIEQAKFLGEGFVALVELVESFVQNSCENKVRRKRPEKLEEFIATAKRFGLQEQDKKLISSSVEKISAKYEFLTKFAPEFVLGVTLAQYGARQAALVRFVDLATKDKEPSAKVEVKT